jgi:uncharacterized protein (UPF0332 family)
VTDENARKNVAAEMGLAESALRAAKALLDLDLAPDAASRTYYAAFHAARALLFSLGLEPRSHQAVRSLIGLHFVKSGSLSSEAARDLSALEGVRTAGDYDSGFAVSAVDLRPDLDRAQRFVEEARGILARAGILPTSSQ